MKPDAASTALVRATFPDWVIRIRDVFDNLRVSLFTAFTYFYLLANPHSCDILDLCARLGRRFYTSKLGITLQVHIFHLAMYNVFGLELSKIPLLSAPAFAFIFAPYCFFGYIGWEIILTIIKRPCDALPKGFIFYETSETIHVLEQAPYMKYRARKVGHAIFF